MSDQDEMYRVEKIVDKRLKNGVEEYLLRWYGYSSEHDSWQREEDCLDCYNLIVVFEAIHFESRLKSDPRITGMKVYHHKIKLLVHWKSLRDKQYFYSSAVRIVDPIMLIDFYESLISENGCDRHLESFHNALTEDKDVFDDCDPEEIIAIARKPQKKLYLISWRRRDEASVVSEEWLKCRSPTLLIEFYEKNIFLQ